MAFYTNVTQIGTRMLHRFIDDDGKRQSELVHFKPTLYIPTKEKTANFRGIRDERLESVEFEGISDARDFIKQYEDVTNFEIHGNRNYWAQFIQEAYTGEVNWNLKQIRVANLDIECLMDDPDNPGLNPIDNPIEAVNRITAITVELNNKYIVFGSKPFTGEFEKDYEVKYMYCESEGKLLYQFLQVWGIVEPDIITGWNINYFDIPYLIGRISKILGDDAIHRLGPTALKYNERTISVREHKQGTGLDISIDGISVIDYMEAYKKFTYKMRERYSLDYIASVHLDHKKIDYKAEGFKNLDDLYDRDYNKYVLYNIRDVELVRRLDDKLNLMMLIMTLTYMCHIRHEDVFSQVRMWDTLIYNYLLDSSVIIPPKAEFHKDSKYEGAYVRDPKVGMHEWVCSFDLNSLYPHLIMQYNISPEMLVPREIDDNVMFKIEDLVNKKADLSFLEDENLSMTANKAFFKKDKQGFLAEIMDQLYGQRKVVKKRMLAYESQSELIKGILKERGVTS